MSSFSEAYGYPAQAKLLHQRLGTITSRHCRVTSLDVREAFWAIDAYLDKMLAGTGWFSAGDCGHSYCFSSQCGMTMQADIAIRARDDGLDPKDRRAIDTIRTLSMDAVQKATSGHSGHANGIGTGRLGDLVKILALRSRPPGLAEP